VLATPATVNPRAYAQYLLGQEQANLRTPDGYRRSMEHFTRALALDSTFAPTWAAIAMTNAYGLLYQTAPLAEARAAVERAAVRAIRLDDHVGDPYFALGLVRLHGDWDFTGAEAEFAKGLARPHSAMARALYGWTSWELGEFDKSVAASLASIELEPTTGQWHSDLAWGYWSGGDGPRARAAALRAIALDSTFYEPNDVLSYTYADAGAHELAERAHERAKAVAGGAFWFDPIARGIVSHASGDTTAIRRALRALGEDDPRYGQKAFLHFGLGEQDQMYQMFDRAIDTRDADVLWILNAVPALYPIRGEPAYQRLLARLGLPEALRR
jgi:serine/threonine-protein kinase